MTAQGWGCSSVVQHVLNICKALVSIPSPKTNKQKKVTTDFVLNKFYFAGCRWLTPIILATWEAEIRRSTV
jgi:hypothetical protein